MEKNQVMSADNDVEEFWSFFRNAPESIPHAPEDVDGYHTDLICRAGKQILNNPVLVEAINFLMTGHPLAGMLRPVVMDSQKRFTS